VFDGSRNDQRGTRPSRRWRRRQTRLCWPRRPSRVSEQRSCSRRVALYSVTACALHDAELRPTNTEPVSATLSGRLRARPAQRPCTDLLRPSRLRTVCDLQPSLASSSIRSHNNQSNAALSRGPNNISRRSRFRLNRSGTCTVALTIPRSASRSFSVNRRDQCRVIAGGPPPTAETRPRLQRQSTSTRSILSSGGTNQKSVCRRRRWNALMAPGSTTL
jgi:hypothetical protein